MESHTQDGNASQGDYTCISSAIQGILGWGGSGVRFCLAMQQQRPSRWLLATAFLAVFPEPRPASCSNAETSRDNSTHTPPTLELRYQQNQRPGFLRRLRCKGLLKVLPSPTSSTHSSFKNFSKARWFQVKLIPNVKHSALCTALQSQTHTHTHTFPCIQAYPQASCLPPQALRPLSP